MRQLHICGLGLMCLAGVLTSCDEGDITEAELSGATEGMVAELTADITGLDTWSSQYTLVLAAFNSESDYAVTQKQVTDDGSGRVRVTMKLTQSNIETLELCVTNRLRQRVVSFASVDMSSASGDTLRLNAGSVDVGMYSTIQELVFNSTCARCHGLGNTPAAGLSLVTGESYDNLVNHAASKPERGTRVVPGDASNSLLHKVIHGDEAAGVSFDHSNMIKETAVVSLIDNWINSLEP